MDVSSVAYCHVHKKLSDIRRTCEGCLLSFAMAKESDCDTYRSLVGILHMAIQLFVDVDQELHLSLPAGKDGQVLVEKSSEYRCSCCGMPLMVKSSHLKRKNPVLLSTAPAPSPRAPFLNSRNEDRGLDLSHIKYTELKLAYDESEPEDSDGISTFQEEGRAVTVPLLMYAEEEDKATPLFGRSNQFFGIPLSDSAAASPRWQGRPLIFRKSQFDRTESISDTPEGTVSNETHSDHMKGQLRLDRKSLMALYIELDEERSASAIAANNAMAMIMRLQAEKAAVQMEALQYQRMMDEQADYDQEALQEMNSLLSKREEEIEELQVELEAYRETYGFLREDDFEMCGEEDGVEVYRVFKPSCYSSPNARSECNSPTSSVKEGVDNEKTPQNHEQSSSVQDENIGDGEAAERLQKSSQADKARSLGRLRNLDKNKPVLSDDGVHSSRSSSGNFDDMVEDTSIQRHNPSH